MVQDKIAKIEAKIKEAGSMNNEKKAELLQLLSSLKSEVGELSKTHGEEAESITGFTKLSAYEAMREKKDPKLIKLSLEGLSSSVKKFETSHPKLVDAVNAISNFLSNIGI